MATLIFFIFIFVWYYPVYKGQGKTNRLSGKTVLKGVLIGMIPVFLAVVLLQIGGGYLLRALHLTGIGSMAFESFFNAAVIEEFLKFFGAWLIIRKLKPQRCVDYVLILGSVGLGFEVAETALLLDSVVAGVFSGIMALHIIWQYWMGLHFFKYREAKQANDAGAARKNLILAFVVPIIMHGLNDFLAFVVESKAGSIDMSNLEINTPETTGFAIWIGALFLFIAIEIVYQIITYRKALRAARESRLDEAETLIDEN